MQIDELTPVEYIKELGIWLKRDDYFNICGVGGGKARAAYQIITGYVKEGYDTIVTVGSRQSLQCEIVSYICQALNLKCHLFVTAGADTPELISARKNSNIEIHKITPGYNNVLISRSTAYAKENHFGYVPFGLSCMTNIEVTSKQVANIPDEVKRLVIPVGSGMTFSSVLNGLRKYNKNIPVLGIMVGKDASSTVNQYVTGLCFYDYELIQSNVNYHDYVEVNMCGINLDPVYEAKCYPYLKEGDLLWIVGHRNNTKGR